MSRAMSWFLPQWPIDRLRRRIATADPSAKPPSRAATIPPATAPAILLISTVAGRQIVDHACDRARARGVRPGMSLAHARALLDHEPRVAPHQPPRDQAALAALAHWATRFSPTVAVDPPDGLLLDVTGCERLFGGDDRLLRLASQALARLGFQARLAIAPTFGCAWALARFGRRTLSRVPPDRLREALDPLPPAALRIEPGVAQALAEIGIDSVGQFLDLPRAGLPARFGEHLLLRLDQALGQALELIDPVVPLAPLRVQRDFDGPTRSLEGIALSVRALADLLSVELRRRARGALRLSLTLIRSDAPPLHMQISLSHPSRDGAHLWTLLRPEVERANLGFGIESIRLAAPAVAPLSSEQLDAWPGATPLSADRRLAQRELGQLIDRLVNRFGPDQVAHADLVESHLPEQSFRLRPIHPTAPDQTPPHAPPPPSHASPAQAMPRGNPADRPSILLPRPEPVEVIALVPDGPPARLRWQGSDRSLTAAFGPERVAAPWWVGPLHVAAGPARAAGPAQGASPSSSSSPAPCAEAHAVSVLTPARSTRDYFRVQDDRGQWFWIYRESLTGRWFLHGLWA